MMNAMAEPGKALVADDVVRVVDFLEKPVALRGLL
jgi:hypothetical protein